MYSHEDPMRAVELYIQYGRRGAATVRDLCYPVMTRGFLHTL
jgi:hypothetical protein